jgi:hypothetical protein
MVKDAGLLGGPEKPRHGAEFQAQIKQCRSGPSVPAT